MAKPKSQFVCVSCGAVSSRWQGRCDSCGEWNTLQEEGPALPASTAAGRGVVVPLRPLSGEAESPPRMQSGIAELDRVTGGGFVPASALLVGGDPGIGKSTLLLQSAAALAFAGKRVIYVSGEEAIDQVRLRAERLGIIGAPVELAAETHVEDILATLKAGPRVDAVIIDSVQTMWTDLAESAPGTVTQVRLAAQNLIRFAKSSGAVVILVGHVTKDGQIAGPRVVEHMVDAVLYFEGDSGHRFRLLRAVKNRFGPASEIGVFEMTGDGLKEVANPSDLFIGERDTHSPGTAIFAGMEGTRPLLVEVQALVSNSGLATPRRAVVGWDPSRLAMLLAVLEARCGLAFGPFDVYLNVAGGLKLAEPAADLAVAAALISSRLGVASLPESIYFGEVSLSGTMRAVPQSAARLKEAGKLGFRRAFLPEAGSDEAKTGLALDKIASLVDMVAAFAARAEAGGGQGRARE